MATEPIQQVKKIEVLDPTARERFTVWIAERGGVQVWENHDLGNMGAGEIFTPVRDNAGHTYGKPHWAYMPKELVTDITRFRFVKEMKEVSRVKIAIKADPHSPFRLILTDGSTRRVRKECGKFPDSSYHFDDREAVITIPVWED